jgi:hypothetical protein
MRYAIDAWDSLRRRIWVGLQPGDETPEVRGRHCVLCDDQLRKTRNKRNWLEILQQIILERIQCSIRNLAIPVSDGQGIAVGRCACHPADADASVGPAYVLNYNGLTERHSHAFGHKAREGVHRPARGGRHHHRDRARRIGLRPGYPRCGWKHGSGRYQMQKSSAQHFHRVPPSDTKALFWTRKTVR